MIYSGKVSLIPVSLVTGLALHRQSRVVLTKTVWATEPDIFTLWPFTDKVCRPLEQMMQKPYQSVTWNSCYDNCLLLALNLVFSENWMSLCWLSSLLKDEPFQLTDFI